jgi:type VI protein secretion system component Hcp
MAMIFLDLVVGGSRVVGDGTAAGFAGQIEIESMSWELEAEQPGKDATAAEKARTHLKAGNLRLSKYFDSASTVLYTHMLKRKGFDKATISVLSMTMHDEAGNNDTMLQVELEKGYVESVDTSASESGKAIAVSESLSLSFKDFKLKYLPADDTGMRRSGVSSMFLHKVEGDAH